MNELFMIPDGQEDYRKFILYCFVYKDVEISLNMYSFANDMVQYNVLKDFFEGKTVLHRSVCGNVKWVYSRPVHSVDC
jgi:hypothetical protein